MSRQPRAKRSTTTDGDVKVVAKNSNGDGSVYFEPARPAPTARCDRASGERAIALPMASVKPCPAQPGFGQGLDAR